MKRYDIVGQWEEQENEFGDWVEHIEATTRIAELTAEVARYRQAMQSIVDDYKQAFHTDWTTATNYADIARNALREG